MIFIERKLLYTMKKGFTLIESIVVISIIGLIAIYAVPKWPRAINLDGQAQQIARDIRLTQSLAMNSFQRYRIQFSSSQYQIFDGSNNAYTYSTLNSSTISLTSGITMTSTATNLIFDSSGNPYQGSTYPGTALSANFTVTLTDSSGQTRQILIAPETGKVTV